MAWRYYVQQRITIHIQYSSVHSEGQFSSQKSIYQNDTQHVQCTRPSSGSRRNSWTIQYC